MRKTYDKAFKVKVAKDIITEDTSVSQVANESMQIVFIVMIVNQNLYQKKM